MLIYFGFAVIVTYKRKEILNVINLIYLVIAAVTGYSYYRENVVFAQNEEEAKVVYLSVFAAIVAGVVIINTLLLPIRRYMSMRGQYLSDRVKKISFKDFWKSATDTLTVSRVYGIMLAVFFALLVIFRNTRGWPVYLVCTFGLYYIRMAVWEKRERLAENICNGILLHFLIMVGYCLLHRPYMFFIYTRYPFIFHTVTVSAVYLAMVVCAALAKLLDAYRRSRSLSCIWKELVVFGISVEYLIFTLSRTGYLAIIVMALIVIPFACLGMKKKLKSLAGAVIMMFMAVVLCFPATFTAQRIIPAIVARPETMDIEELPSEIVHGRDMDSKYYITIRRFLQVFEMKVLGIPEDKCIKSFDYAKDDIVPVDKMLVVSADFSGDQIPEGEAYEMQESDAEAYANGRFDIFELYAANMNMQGHDKMEIILPNGEMIAHAHNVYLQVAYDHGIPIGIVFIVFGFCTFIQSLIYDIKRKEDRRCSIFPLAILIAFAVAGLTEWIFHPCNPITFCLLLALAPLLVDVKKRSRGNV